MRYRIKEVLRAGANVATFYPQYKEWYHLTWSHFYPAATLGDLFSSRLPSPIKFYTKDEVMQYICKHQDIQDKLNEKDKVSYHPVKLAPK